MPCCWIVTFKTEFHELELQYYYFTHTNMILQNFVATYFIFISVLNRIGLKFEELFRETMQTNSDLDLIGNLRRTQQSLVNIKNQALNEQMNDRFDDLG